MDSRFVDLKNAGLSTTLNEQYILRRLVDGAHERQLNSTEQVSQV